MEMIQQTTSVKGTLSRMEDWLQDWCSSYTRQGYLPIHSMILENGNRKLYWHFSGKPAAISGLSFVFERKGVGSFSATFQYFDDEEIRPYAEKLFREFSDEWSTHIPPLGFDVLVIKPGLATLLEARWAESEKAAKAEAFLASTVLLGSVLEGVLVDMCYRYPKLAGNANSRKRDGRGKNLPFEKWHLDSLIDVAHECKWITRHTREQSKSLRQYRNIIHPQEQLNLDYYPNQDTCSLCREVVTVAMGDMVGWISKQAGSNP